MTNTIFNYDAQTGEFINESTADESPLEPGVILVPAFATTTRPPETVAHEVAIFTDGQWLVKADWRGVHLFSVADGSPVSIDEIGKEPVDVGATDQAMPGETYSWNGDSWVIDQAKVASQLIKVKAGKWEAIKAERDLRIQSGGYKVGAKWFHSDTFSRTQQMGLVMLGGGNIPANTPWKTMDGTSVTMTQALAGQIFATAAASDIAIFAAAEAHRAAMESSADPSAYDFSGGWPKVFGE